LNAGRSDQTAGQAVVKETDMQCMKSSRRQFLNLATGAVALPLVPRPAKAESYPSRPVRILLGFPPGITPDITARLIGQWLSDRIGRQFIVENRTGAAGNIATELVVRAPPDGYTLLLVTLANAVNATLYDNLNFNFLRDIAPVANIIRGPLVMEVNPSVPAKSVPEFIAYARANPGKLNMASAGPGTPQHVAGELFMMMTGIDMVHVPYPGTPLPDVLSGRMQIIFNPIPTSIGYIQQGKLRALGVTGLTRAQALPAVPTVAEFVPGYEAGSWYGIGAPKNTPPELIEMLNTEINAALADPAIQTRFADLGAEPMAMTPAGFGKFLADETEKWGKVVKVANIKVE
jgi:tripartite-type tricarboxylate transporter receptor subunit TctC